VHLAKRYDYEFGRLYAHMIHEQIRQLSDTGRGKEAVHLLQAPANDRWFKQISPRPGVTTQHEIFAMTYARACMENGAINDAIQVLRNWFVFTKERQCRRSVVRLGILLTRAFLQNGDSRSARRYMIEALRHGQEGRFIRSFLDEGKLVTNLLCEIQETDHALAKGDRDYLKILVDTCNPAGREQIEAHWMGGSIEPVTQREIQIIELAAEGLPNGEIGTALGLAESSVKWYWQRIFFKLEVRKRSQAIRRARYMGLLGKHA